MMMRGAGCLLRFPPLFIQVPSHNLHPQLSLFAFSPATHVHRSYKHCINKQSEQKHAHAALKA
jgi:hypothetical protein